MIMENRQPVPAARRLLSYLICYLVAVQPMLPAVAAQITPVTPGTKVDAAGNGVPMVNIATPNQAGISHNQYQQYNVGTEGVILNNATSQLTLTQLGGLVQNNTNLKAGQEARAIVNEVVGANRSQLQGYTEVAGKAARVMVANPYGITCNGCGFINTPNVTLTTGKPQLDAGGNLAALEVTKGSIIVEGQGLDGSKADAVAIVARAVEINAGIHAKDLAVTAGANRVGQDGSVTPIAGEGALPSVAVDTGALGGMYANRIHLVSSENGVGVNLGTLLARQGDIVLDAKGRLAVHDSQSSGALTATAQHIALSGDHQSAGPVTLSASNDIALNNARLAGDKGVTIQSGQALQLAASQLTAGESLALSAGDLNADGASKIGAAGDITMQATRQLNNAGQLNAGNHLVLNAAAIGNSGTLLASGRLEATGSLDNQGAVQGNGVALKGDTLRNAGTVLASDRLDVTGNSLDNQGTLQGNTVTLNADTLQNGSMVLARDGLNVTGSRLNNLGTLQGNAVTLNSDTLQNGGTVLASDSLDVTGNSLENLGTLQGNRVTLKGDALRNGGTMLAGDRFDVIGNSLENLGTLQGNGVTLNSDALRNGGTLRSNGSLMLKGNTLDQTGTLDAAGDMTLIYRDRISNAAGGNVLTDGTLSVITGELMQDGTFSAGTGMMLASDSLTSGQDAGTFSKGDLSLQVNKSADIDGTLSADGQLNSRSDTLRTGASAHLQGQNIALYAGRAVLAGMQIARQQLAVSAGQLSLTGNSNARDIAIVASDTVDNPGSLVAENQLQIKAAQLSNSGTASGNTVSLLATDSLNNGGVLTAGTQMQVSAGTLNNSGRLAAPQLSLSATAIDNRGLVQGDRQLTLLSRTLANRQSGSIATAGDLDLDLPDFSNDGLLTAAGTLQLNGFRLTNAGEINAASLTATSALLNNLAGGKLLATQAVQLGNTQLINGGLIAADRLTVKGGTVDNSGRLQGSDSLNLQAGTLGNAQSGELLTAGQLSVKAGQLDNAGLLQGNQLTLSADDWRNSGNALSVENATLAAKNLNNSGRILGQNAVQVQTDAASNDGLLMAKVLAFQGDLRNSGVIQGNDALTVAGGEVINASGGQLQTAASLDLRAETLNNQGTVQASDATINAQHWQNAGSTRTTTDLAATVTGQLLNSGILLSQHTMNLQASALNNAGTLAADSLAITVPQLVNRGLLQGNGVLTLNSPLIVNQADGQIISGGSLVLQPDQLSNEGLIQVADTLSISGGDVGNDGQITARTLSADLSGTLTNGSTGRLLAQELADIHAQAITNAGIIAGQRLRTAGERLQNHGLMQGGTAITANFRQLETLTGGQLLTGGALVLQGTDASNAGIWQGDNLSYQFASLKNTGSLNGTTGLEGRTDGVLDNAGSQLSGGNASLTAGRLLNSGKIIADGLELSGAQLINSGLWQGNSTLTAQAEDGLTQTADGKTLSGGDLLLNASALNTAGVVQGGTAQVIADSWQHSGSLLGSASLTASIAGTLNNGGALLSQGDMQISAVSLLNSGSMLAEKAAVLSGSTLNNSGTVQGDTLTVRPASVTNQGSLIGLQSLTFAAAPQVSRFRTLLATPMRELINNAGGQLLTQGTLNISGNTLTNNGVWQGQQILLEAGRLTNNGTIQSADALQLNLSDSLDAAAGNKISANGTAALHALSLSNQGQWIARNLTLTGDTLNNNGDITGVDGLTVQLNGALIQQQDKTLLSAGKLSVQSATVNNAGRVQGGELEVTTGTLDNNGRLQGDNILLLSTRGRLTNNGNGTLLGGTILTLTTPELYNNGLIQGGTSRITASGLASNGGRVLSAGELTFTTAQLLNSGWLQAGQLVLNAANTSNNGTLLADQQGTLTGTVLQNQAMTQGANLTVNYQQLNNSGTVLGTGQLNINAAQVNQQATGRLFSAGTMTLVTNGFDLLGQLVALGDATLNVANGFVARSALAAGNRLTISTNGTLENRGTLQGQAVTLSAGGELVNNGLLTTGTGDSSLSANRIAMNAAGSLQGGGNVALNSRSDVTLDGFTGTRGSLTITAPGSIVNTALLYAAQNLSLLADSIRNQRGDILAGNSLWMQRDAAGNANGEVINTSGTIETQGGDIIINTAHLLNQWESVNIGQTTTENVATGYGSVAPGSVELPLELFESGELKYYFTEIYTPAPPIISLGWSVTPVPLNLNQSKEILVARTTSSTTVTGQAGRISSGRNLTGNANQLDNLGSYILAGQDLSLSGEVLNNQSYLSGTQAVWRIFNPSTTYSSYDSLKNTNSSFVANSIDGLKATGGNHYTYNGKSASLKGTVTYVATDTYRTEQASTIRGVIQSNGNLSTRFNTVLNNSESQDVRGTITPTLSSPGLNTLLQQSISGGVTRLEPVNVSSVAPGSPDWRNNINNALQQVNGGISLDGSGLQNTLLNAYKSDAIQLSGVGGTTALGTNPFTAYQRDSNTLHYSSVDTSAYPLPQSSNGYFTASTDLKSRYLIVINPKINELGQLNTNLFSDLNALLDKQPGTAPQETRQQYTDITTFLGSSYLLDRLNLKPDYDYRVLGDAAFDTRYVSNAVLSQTGNRYINGLGSDLEQMKYLMDNAATAQQSLNLTMGVTLSTAQIASLNQSIIWWEAATINGETVLVPKLYLVASDTNINNGSIIAGKTVTIEGGSVTNNGSTVIAQERATINSQNDINNLNASLIKAAGDLKLSSLGDINNIGAAISGKQVSLESLNGSINNLTLTSQIDNSSKLSVSSLTEQGEKSSILSLDNLVLNAGKDINIHGADINAGGNAAINAAGNVAILANENNTLFNDGWRDFKSINSVASTIEAGGTLTVHSGQDLTVKASNISADKNASLSAGGDLKLLSVVNSTEDRAGNSESSVTKLNQTTLTAGNNLTLAAGQDLTSQAAALAAGGDVGLTAGRDINLDAAAIGSGNSEKGSKKTVISETVRQQGTEIASGGNTRMVAGRDINSQAADLTANQDIALQAGRDVSLNTATESDYAYREETKTKKGLLSKKTTHTIQEDSATQEKGTLLSGNNVSVSAGNNIVVKGSQVVGDNQVALSAGNNVTITAATNTDSSWRFSETKKSGLMGTGGLGISIGSSTSLSEMRDKGTTQSQSVSTVGSTGGDVSITAGKQLQVNGSDLVAAGNMVLQGDSVAITPGHDRRTRDQRTEQRSSGLTLALSGAVGEAVNSAVAAAQSAKQESDGRLAALQATKAVLSGVQAEQASQLAQVSADPNNGVGISLSLSTQQAKSQQQQRSDTVSGSTLNAGKNLSISATGKGNDADSGNLLIAGSQLKAAGDTSLQAANDILLTGAASTLQTTGSNSSSGGGVGLSFGAGSGSMGLSVFASVNGAKGHETGNGTVWSETTLDSGGTVSLSSGRDTTLSGAQVSGNSVVADVGRDLTITSLRDSERYDSTQSSFAAGGSFTFGSMSGSGYLNASQDKMHSNFDSVQEQSGIYAGSGGVDVTVGNHTQLNGAVIASQADADKNRLETGTLGFSDITNKADYQTQHQGVGISSGASAGGQFAGNMANSLLAGAGSSGSAQGTSRSAVTGGTIVIRDQANQRQDVATLSRDTAGANGSISPIFNKEKEQQRLQETQLIAEVGSQVSDIARTQGQITATKAAKEKLSGATQSDRDNALADLKKQDPTKQYSDDDISQQVYNNFYNRAFTESGFGTGGKVQQAIQAATAAVQGLAGGDIAKAIAGGSAPYLAEVIHKMTTDANGNVNTEANLMAHAVLGAVVAQINGNSALAGAAGATTGEYIAQQLYPGVKREDLSEEQKQTISALGTLAAGLAGGVAGDSTADAVAGAQAGKNALENNNLASTLAAAEASKKGTVEKYEAAQKAICAQDQAACTQMVKDVAGTGLDFVPIVGDIKSFAEAQTALDYLAAAIGLIPGAGDAAGKAIKAAETALKKGDVAEASKLINKASDEIQAVKPLDVGSYKELKAREVVGDGLEHDHIPSFAAIRQAKENELGRKLTPTEEKNLYNNATAIEVPKDVHQAGPTYGGKNTPSQVKQDAINLCGAECRDTDALRKNMLDRGYDPKLVDDAIRQLKERNSQIGVTK
ncbi:filamentous hemagglutinin N-terminal domain-containing protein [Erwinia psidii]|nr:filamentous hemagglutinin N-terminal domain-containing protein [Erwinia psidii]